MEVQFILKATKTCIYTCFKNRVQVRCLVYFAEGVDFHLSSFNTDGGSLENENNNVTPRNGTS